MFGLSSTSQSRCGTHGSEGESEQEKGWVDLGMTDPLSVSKEGDACTPFSLGLGKPAPTFNIPKAS